MSMGGMKISGRKKMKKTMTKGAVLKLAKENFYSFSQSEAINFAKKLGIEVIEKPLEFDLECEWVKHSCKECGMDRMVSISVKPQILHLFDGKKTKVKITEIL